jgi:hypothetical protein
MNLAFWEKVQEVSKLYGIPIEGSTLRPNIVKFETGSYNILLTEHLPLGIITVSYWKDGSRHRLIKDGAAYEEFGTDGKSVRKFFYEEGRAMRDPEFPNET